jgi:ketosteroid isomerase-like protein
MASENVEIVRRVFAAFDAGEEEELLSLLDDEVDWGVSGYLTGERNLRGKPAVAKWLRDVSSLRADEEIEIFQDQESYRDLDPDTVLVLGGGRIRRRQGVLEEEVGWIWRIEGGRVVRMTDFLSHGEALAAAEALG